MLLNLTKRLFVLLLLIPAWFGALWYAIPIDISRFNPLSLLALHALPPLVAWGSWSFWRNRSRQAAAKAEDTAREKTEAEQKAKLETGRKEFDESLRARQFALDCRWAEIRSDQSDLIGTEEVGAMPERASSSTTSERLLAALTQSLAELFSNCSGAQRLPIFVAESAVFDRALAAQAVSASCDASILPQVRVMPSTEGVADTIFARFESDPNLPGALFLAVDGAENLDEDEEQPAQPKHADALVMMLFTHPDFDAALADLETGTGKAGDHQYDPMTPFWERNQRQLEGLSERLARLSGDASASLAQLPVLGQLRRPVAVAGKKADVAWCSAIEQALINANLKQLVFETEPASAAAADTSAKDDIPCAWLVHNAGSFETAGDKLAALGRGLDDHGINLNIIRQATNVLAEVKLGAVDQWASVALALARAQALEAPTLWAAFGSHSAVGLVTTKT